MLKIEFLIKYLKLRVFYFIMYFMMLVLLPLVNYLYSFPIEAILYSFTITTFVLVLCMLYDMYRQYRKYLELEKLIKHASIHTINLGPSNTFIEEEYQQLIKNLYRNIGEILNNTEEKNMENMDYFMAWVHQIKTPIAALSLLLQRDENQGKDTVLLKQEVFRIEQYVDMALQFLRINYMTSDLNLYECSIEKVVQQTVKKYSTIFIQKKISLKLTNLQGTVISDEKWLSLILEQIISNSLKYTNAGSISIYQDEKNRLIIEDTGIGIRSEDIERIFERGFTGYNGRLGEKSSGLGLFLSKKVAGRLGIKIELTSEIQVGTKAAIIFPTERLDIF